MRNGRAEIAQALEFLKSGGVVVFPTDTLYGLGADAFSIAAVNRIFQIKQRPSGLALPVLVDSWDQALTVAREAPDWARKLAQRFWPGPLTLILSKSEALPVGVTGGGDTVAVRMPNHPVALELIRGLGGPITGTSANRSGGQDLQAIEEVEAQLGKDVDYIIKLGPAPIGVSSTVVDATSGALKLVRQGALDFQEILAAAGLSE